MVLAQEMTLEQSSAAVRGIDSETFTHQQLNGYEADYSRPLNSRSLRLRRDVYDVEGETAEDLKAAETGTGSIIERFHDSYYPYRHYSYGSYRPYYRYGFPYYRYANYY